MSEEPSGQPEPPVSASSPVSAHPVAGEAEFVRVHPISPFIRGGLIVLAVLGYLLSQQVDAIAGLASDPSFAGDDQSAGPLLLQAAALGLAVLGAILLGLASWWFTRYHLGEESLEMRSGALFRQHRQVRYDRIQAVDLVRPLLARLTGLSEVRVESAGGGDSHVAIAYLRHAEAEEVRSRLLGLAREANAPGVEGPAAPGREGELDEAGLPHAPVEPQGQHLLSVPVDRLVASVLLSWDTILLACFVVLILVLLLLDLAPVVGGFLPLLFIAGVRALLRLTRWYGLTVTRRGETLTSQRGLTDTRSSTVPLRRVQAIEVAQPMLWRSQGWWSLKVNVAGAQIGSSEAGTSDSMLVPVATTREMLGLLELITGDDGTTAEVAALTRGTPVGFVGQPQRARPLHPLALRRIGYLPGRRAMITRSGWVNHVLQVVPWGRVQSLALRQGLIARRLDLATVHLVSTVGPVVPHVQHLARADGEALIDLARTRSGHARRDEKGPFGCDPAPDTVDWGR